MSPIMLKGSTQRKHISNQKEEAEFIQGSHILWLLSDQHQMSYSTSVLCVNIWHPSWSFGITFLGHTILQIIELVILTWLDQATTSGSTCCHGRITRHRRHVLQKWAIAEQRARLAAKWTSPSTIKWWLIRLGRSTTFDIRNMERLSPS